MSVKQCQSDQRRVEVDLGLFGLRWTRRGTGDALNSRIVAPAHNRDDTDRPWWKKREIIQGIVYSRLNIPM